MRPRAGRTHQNVRSFFAARSFPASTTGRMSPTSSSGSIARGLARAQDDARDVRADVGAHVARRAALALPLEVRRVGTRTAPETAAASRVVATGRASAWRQPADRPHATRRRARLRRSRAARIEVGADQPERRDARFPRSCPRQYASALPPDATRTSQRPAPWTGSGSRSHCSSPRAAPRFRARGERHGRDPTHVRSSSARVRFVCVSAVDW